MTTPDTLPDPTPGDGGTTTQGPPHIGFDLAFTRIIRVVGLAIAMYETLWEQVDRPYLLLLACAMMIGTIGLEILLRRGGG